MLELLKAIKELSDHIFSNDLEDEVSQDTLEVAEKVENYLSNDPGENLLIVLSDEETYDVSGYLIFCDESELEKINDGKSVDEVIDDDRWIRIE